MLATLIFTIFVQIFLILIILYKYYVKTPFHRIFALALLPHNCTDSTMWDTQFHGCQKKGSKNLNGNFVIIFHKMLFRSNQKKIWVIRFTFIIIYLIKHRKLLLLYLPDIFKIPLLFSPTTYSNANHCEFQESSAQMRTNSRKFTKAALRTALHGLTRWA